MLSEHAICCSMCPPLEVKESPKEKGDVILEKKKKKDCIWMRIVSGEDKNPS